MERNVSFFIQQRMIRARSLAVVNVSHVHPLHQAIWCNKIRVIAPQMLCLLIHHGRNPSTVPPTCSAMAPQNRYEIPASVNNTDLQAIPLSFPNMQLHIRHGCRPCRHFHDLIKIACSSVTRRVIILVVLAMGITSLSCFSKRIRPVSASIRTADRAYRFSGVPSAVLLCLFPS